MLLQGACAYPRYLAVSWGVAIDNGPSWILSGVVPSGFDAPIESPFITWRTMVIGHALVVLSPFLALPMFFATKQGLLKSLSLFFLYVLCAIVVVPVPQLFIFYRLFNLKSKSAA